MADFYESLSQVKHSQRIGQRPDRLQSGILIDTDGSRYLVHDGNEVVSCESGVSIGLKINDRVWLMKGKATTIIIGICGTNRDAEE